MHSPSWIVKFILCNILIFLHICSLISIFQIMINLIIPCQIPLNWPWPGTLHRTLLGPDKVDSTFGSSCCNNVSTIPNPGPAFLIISERARSGPGPNISKFLLWCGLIFIFKIKINLIMPSRFSLNWLRPGILRRARPGPDQVD